MRIGFFTGSVDDIGSGKTMVWPLANALNLRGHDATALGLSRFWNGRTEDEDVAVARRPLFREPSVRSLRFLRDLWSRRTAEGYPLRDGEPDAYDRAVGEALMGLTGELDLDLLYAFHNSSVLQILDHWPQPDRLLVINLVGFGIDPSRGGAVDTFPVQDFVFRRPYWDLHITATEFEREQYCAVYQQLGISPEKLVWLPHSFDEETFRPGERAARSRDDGAPFTLVYPVNVYRRKNIELAIDVVACLNGTHPSRLLVTGKVWDRRYLSSLKTRARRLGVAGRVEFLGGIPYRELISLYQKADLTLFTSHQETFGIGVVESLGCGTPVVGPDWIIPTVEILRALPGARAAAKTPEALAGAARSLLAERPAPDIIAREAQNRYGNKAIASRFLQVTGELLQQKHEYAEKVHSINWKGLYRDEGDLL